MRLSKRTSSLLPSLALALVACTDGAPTDASTDRSGPAIEVRVAPLELDDVDGATWRITVTNGASALVWSEDVASEQYGNSSGIAYVGPCDASAPAHTVALELLALRSGGATLVAGSDYQNPAPVGSPLVKQVDCLPNADALASFDVTLLRTARQGFFDIAVSFEDIFCSAKIDCDTTLLFHPHTSQRERTIVMGFTCAAGGGAATWLHLDDVTITCSGLPDPIVIDVDAGPGNLDPAFPGPPNTTDLLFQAATYRGLTALEGLAYWNVALGINTASLATVGTCHLTSAGTASSAAWTTGTSPVGSRWPVVTWDLELTAGGALTCGATGLDDADDVSTTYREAASFDASYDAATDTVTRHGITPPPAQAPRLMAFAATGEGGRELWVTDCTESGTREIAINPNAPTPFDREGCENDNPFETYVCDWYEQDCQWQPNGQFCGADGGSKPQQLVPFAGYLYFTADDGTHGRELWRTDGTTAVMVVDLNPGGDAFATLGEGDVYAASHFAEVDGALYFFASDGEHGFEIFKTTGDIGEGAVTLVADLRTGASDSNPNGWARNGTTRAAFRADADDGSRTFVVGAGGSLVMIDYAGGRPPFDRVEPLSAAGDYVMFETWGQSGVDPERTWILPPGTTVARQAGLRGRGCGFELAGEAFVACVHPSIHPEENGICRIDGDGDLTLVDGTRWFRECSTPIAPTVPGDRAFFAARFTDLSPDRRAAVFDGTTTTALDPIAYFGQAGPTAFFAGSDAGFLRIDPITLASRVIFDGYNVDAFAELPPANAVVLGAAPAGSEDRKLVCVDLLDPEDPIATTIPLAPGDNHPQGFKAFPPR